MVKNISNDNFIRTTNKFHEKEVQKILTELYNKKYIYKGHYESYYCVGCEQYLPESDLKDGKCILHNREPELRKEEAYLFKLSKFQNKLLNLIKSDKYKILPKERKKEVLSFIKSGLNDISISRRKEQVNWGIELPFDKNHICFVWVDAFWNYVTGLKEKNKFNKFWSPDIQLMAKDILRVHATIWPALLLATNNKLPRTLFIHGYFTVNGQKMSKSLGNVVSPSYLVENYGADSVRYFLIRNISLGQDGDFSEEALISRHNNELANDLGNLVSRVLTLAEKNFSKGLKKSQVDKKLFLKLNIKKIDSLMENFEINNALSEIWKFINECNKHINQEKPWEMKGKELEKHIYSLLESIRIISILLIPFLPETSNKIFSQLNQKPGKLKEAKPSLVKIYKVKKEGILFNKIEEKMLKPDKMENNLDKIDIKEFSKLDLRVARIKEVGDHPDAKKLYILILDLGKGEHELQVVSGLKENYKKEELINKRVIVIRNLKHAVIRGIESQGMLLAAVFKDKVSLVQPDKDIEIGAKVM